MAAKSPCIGVCMIDSAHNWCVGCFRTLDEIGDWPSMDEDTKHAVLRNVEARRTTHAVKPTCEPA